MLSNKETLSDFTLLCNKVITRRGEEVRSRPGLPRPFVFVFHFLVSIFPCAGTRIFSFFLSKLSHYRQMSAIFFFLFSSISKEKSLLGGRKLCSDKLGSFLPFMVDRSLSGNAMTLTSCVFIVDKIQSRTFSYDREIRAAKGKKNKCQRRFLNEPSVTFSGTNESSHNGFFFLTSKGL